VRQEVYEEMGYNKPQWRTDDAGTKDPCARQRGLPAGSVRTWIRGKGPHVVTIKRYPHGKIFASADGDPAYARQVDHALTRTVDVEPTMDCARFRAMLQQAGVPDPAIDEYVESIRLVNEVYLTDDSSF
jgi:hypothetical protein